MSNSLDPDQARHWSGLIWVQTVCKGYQQAKSKFINANLSESIDTDQSERVFTISFGFCCLPLSK